MALTDDILAYWKLDEASTGNRADSVGSRTLEATDTPAAAGIIGNGAGIDPFTNFNLTLRLTLADSAAMRPQNLTSFTVSGWIRFYDTENDPEYGFPLANVQTLASLSAFDVSDPLQFAIGYALDNSTPAIQLRFKDSGGSFVNLTSTFPDAIVFDEWYFVVFWYDDDAEEIGLAVNGVETTASHTDGFVTSAITRFALGGSQSGAFFTYATVDECGFWTRALDSAERDELYNAGDGLSYPFAQAGYELNGNPGGTSYAVSGAAATFTLSNADPGSFAVIGGDAKLQFSGAGTEFLIQCLDILIDPTTEALPIDLGTNDLDLIEDPSSNNNARGLGDRNPLYPNGSRRRVRRGGSGIQPNRNQHNPLRAYDDFDTAVIGGDPIQVDVLANDTYTGQPTIEIISGPVGRGATATVSGGGNESLIVYTPPPRGNGGQDRIRYRLRATGNRGSSVATLRITVTREGTVGPPGWPGSAVDLGDDFYYFVVTHTVHFPASPGYLTYWDIVNTNGTRYDPNFQIDGIDAIATTFSTNAGDPGSVDSDHIICQTCEFARIDLYYYAGNGPPVPALSAGGCTWFPPEYTPPT